MKVQILVLKKEGENFFKTFSQNTNLPFFQRTGLEFCFITLSSLIIQKLISDEFLKMHQLPSLYEGIGESV